MVADKPGTEGLLALAIAHVIVSEKLFDAEFVAQGTSGFAEWSAALASYAPDTVAPQIDVPAASIQRVAREFAQRQPSVAVGDSRDVASLTAIYASCMVALRPSRVSFSGRMPCRTRFRELRASFTACPAAKAQSQSPAPTSELDTTMRQPCEVLSLSTRTHSSRCPKQKALGSHQLCLLATFASFLDGVRRWPIDPP